MFLIMAIVLVIILAFAGLYMTQYPANSDVVTYENYPDIDPDCIDLFNSQDSNHDGRLSVDENRFIFDYPAYQFVSHKTWDQKDAMDINDYAEWCYHVGTPSYKGVTSIIDV